MISAMMVQARWADVQVLLCGPWLATCKQWWTNDNDKQHVNHTLSNQGFDHRPAPCVRIPLGNWWLIGQEGLAFAATIWRWASSSKGNGQATRALSRPSATVVSG